MKTRGLTLDSKSPTTQNVHLYVPADGFPITVLINQRVIFTTDLEGEVNKKVELGFMVTLSQCVLTSKHRNGPTTSLFALNLTEISKRDQGDIVQAATRSSLSRI